MFGSKRLKYCLLYFVCHIEIRTFQMNAALHRSVCMCRRYILQIQSSLNFNIFTIMSLIFGEAPSPPSIEERTFPKCHRRESSP